MTVKRLMGRKRLIINPLSASCPSRETIEGITGTGICRAPTGGEDKYRIPVDQIKHLNLSKDNLIQRHQSMLLSKPHLLSHSWNNTTKPGTGSVNRHASNKREKTLQTGSLTIYMQNPAYSRALIQQHPAFRPERKKMAPLFQWSFDTVQLKNTKGQSTLDSSPSTGGCSDNALSSSVWHQNRSLTEVCPSEESDLSESEMSDDAQLSYFKEFDNSICTEVIEKVEEFYLKSEAQMFPYPDILPPHAKTSDQQEMAFSNCEKWTKGADATNERTLAPFVGRLLQIERMQQLTIQKEKSKAARMDPNASASARSISPRNNNQRKQTNHHEPKRLPKTCVDRVQRQNYSQGTEYCKCKSKCYKCSLYNRKWIRRPSWSRPSSKTHYWTHNITSRHPKSPRLSKLKTLILHKPTFE